MTRNLIEYRDQVMKRVNKALDAVWPARLGDEFVRESLWAVSELEKIAQEMKTKSFDQVEQSRTYRFLGAVYSDLMPSKGKEMLLKSRDAYLTAEHLLEAECDDLERAKLYFNFANTLRLIDPNDVEQLQKSEKYLIEARDYFSQKAPEYLEQVDEALRSVKALLAVAPLAKSINGKIEEMAGFPETLTAGGNTGKTVEKMRKLMNGERGIAGIIGQITRAIGTLPGELKQGNRFIEIQKQMDVLCEQFIGRGETDPKIMQIASLLSERLKSDIEKGIVTNDRAAAWSNLLDDLMRILSGDENDLDSLLSKLEKLRELMSNQFETAHYLSHGIQRPYKDRRAADLVELNWQLRRYLLEEMSRAEKGEEESKEVHDLRLRAERVDRRIYEAGKDDVRASSVERQELRPLALAIRGFSGRMSTMPCRPIWRVSNVAVDTNSAFYSGPSNELPFVAAVCRDLALDMMAEPIGESFAAARWNQLLKAMIAIFDMRLTDKRDRAVVTYELGIALTLGRPVLVIAAKNQTIPFDVDVDPVVLGGGVNDAAILGAAIDQTVIRTHPRLPANTVLKTLEYVLASYTRPHPNVYVDQSLRMLHERRKSPDPLMITRTLRKLFDYLKDGETILINPLWPPAYFDFRVPRLFHVMPFGPEWADEARDAARAACQKAGVEYIRGDLGAERDIIRSIWEEIARATHVLVDLTGLNANVALELGIADTLGKKVLMVSQQDIEGSVFKSISKLRLKKYDIRDLDKTFGKNVAEFLLEKHS